MKVKEIMTKDISTVDENADISEAARLMEDRNIGSVPVVTGGHKPIGMLTDRDIVVRAVSSKKENASRVKDVMTDNIICSQPEMDVNMAANLMAENQIRRLPVVENDQIVGMVSLGDIATKSGYMEEAGEALSTISRPSIPKD